MTNQAQKWEKRCSREKSIKHRFLAPLLGPRIDFWSILGTPRGPKNPPKEGTIIGGRGLGSYLVAAFRRFSAFLSILPPFWVNSGSILGHPGSNFINFGSFFVVCVCVCLLFGGVLYFLGLLGCCVVGLLGCWVDGLVGWWIVELDCWIVGLLVCCSVGLLVCWSVAILVCWILNPARWNARSD